MPAQKRAFSEEPINTNINNNYEEERQVVEQEEEETEAATAFSFQQNGHSAIKQSSLDGEQKHEDEQEAADDGDDDEDEDEEEEEVAEEQKQEDEDGEDSKGTQSSSSEDEKEKPEFVIVELSDIRKEVQCPICLVFDQEPGNAKTMNNECPACRTHCASRRSLRDDPNYDALIAALYPDIDKYEEEELAFHEEERTRNKQIQASIAQIFQRQSEALVKRRSMGKETGPFTTRSQRAYRTSRRRRSNRGTDFEGSEDNEEEHDDNGGKDSSSTDERSTEVRPRRRKRRSGVRPSQPSSSAVNSEGGCTENDPEASRESRGLSPGLAWNTAWGRGGTRSHTRHGNGCNNKNSRSTRLSKLVEYLRSLEERNDELDVHLMLISLDKQNTPSLQQPYLCCRPSLSVRHLCEYVAHQTPLHAEEVEILLVKGQYNPDDDISAVHPPISMEALHTLKGQETLATLKVCCASGRDRLVLAYRQKESS